MSLHKGTVVNIDKIKNIADMQHMWSLGPDLLDRRQALRLRV